MSIGVAISTTGHPHRLRFLETCVQHWRKALPLGSVIVVTVDGTEADAQRARAAVDKPQEGGHVGGNTYRVGQPWPMAGISETSHPGGRWGVAVNKNTGIEYLMQHEYIEHLFLCDDDTWPLYPQSLTKHTDLGIRHSMVMWGKSRFDPASHGAYAEWVWPRGVLLYQHRVVVETVGGMDERFGPGGHEHVEWSQRIHNAGLTPAPFISPASYTTRGYMGAAALWAAVDMPTPGEPRHMHARRKARHTTVERTREEWERIEKIMKEREGSSDFVPFQAHENGRASATLIRNIPSQGAEESK